MATSRAGGIAPRTFWSAAWNAVGGVRLRRTVRVCAPWPRRHRGRNLIGLLALFRSLRLVVRRGQRQRSGVVSSGISDQRLHAAFDRRVGREQVGKTIAPDVEAQ